LRRYWGASDTNATPRLERNASTVLHALYEQKLTIIEAAEVLAYTNKAFRALLAQHTKDRTTRANLERMNGMRPADHEAQVESTLNRFERLSRNKLLRTAFGQTEISLDFRAAIEEGGSGALTLPS
jgi:hypothetical protein